MEVTRANAWAEAVTHVLAHVRAGAELAPSLWSPAWVAFVAEHRGGDCTLDEDARLLERLLTSHEAHVQAQLVAWLFRDEARVVRVRARELASLGPDDVDAPALLASVKRAGAAAEIVRAAAELALPTLARLPPQRFDATALASALDVLRGVAPALADLRVEVVRPLGFRGRVHDECIWIGSPERELDVSIEHAAWQAAHEATVYEVGAEGMREHAPQEREALARLARRAREAGLAEPHARWRAAWSSP